MIVIRHWLGQLSDSHRYRYRRLGNIRHRRPTRRRIAAGAGVDPAEIDQFFKQFEGMVAAMSLMCKQRPYQA